ncbi:MAG: DNA-directed RNA polymerase subunit alpha [Candidatus Nealsonbacteria bacterium CG03_land_8_20_14_0_80_36_12]|uniref:DNA-directed RNA polymerase subunit alpha n=1 Tax=Candidatus Nealsonbacteria bacterium CG03_land_8_20_14_0_80_36_12 TaxID=1974701 RepID=A0A2M7BYY2_9BACT|nr:MAG: DNA-directed RNA polymerase subunit alpha [Candidatus Nealsonbacteria bacterium CG03_land_8_20_14_0_80_36_12]
MISLSKPPKIIKKKRNWALFEIEALYPGYGLTIGNSLRRVLLSSLEGAAITRVKIKGVQHEFSTIPGVLEDVITILLQLKQVRFKLYGDQPQRVSLKIKGERKVKASDFELPSQVEIINKDIHIATLTSKKAELNMEVLIEKGVGYQPVEQRKKEKLAIGEIALDAIYTPIRRVNFKVENMRVGERTDFDRLFLEIETDETISPQQALLKASQILLNHYSLFEQNLVKETKEKVEGEEKVEEKEVSRTKVEELKVSARTQNILISNNIKTVGGLLRKNEASLIVLKGMGEKGIKEIKKALKKLGLELK